MRNVSLAPALQLLSNGNMDNPKAPVMLVRINFRLE